MEKLIKERNIEICKDCKVEMIEESDTRCPSCDRASWDCGTLDAVEQTITRIMLK
jgi:hypothetical protein